MARALRAPLALLLSVMWIAAAAGSASAGGGGCHGAFTDEVTDEIKVAMNCFSPTVARVDVGDTVTWSSGKTEAPHTVTAASAVFTAGDGSLPSNSQLTTSFTKPGVYPYACLLHPGMVGAVVVGGGDTKEASAAVPAVTSADRPPAFEPTSASLTPVAVGAGALLLATGGVVALRRSGRARRAVPPTAPAP